MGINEVIMSPEADQIATNHYKVWVVPQRRSQSPPCDGVNAEELLSLKLAGTFEKFIFGVLHTEPCQWKINHLQQIRMWNNLSLVSWNVPPTFMKCRKSPKKWRWKVTLLGWLILKVLSISVRTSNCVSGSKWAPGGFVFFSVLWSHEPTDCSRQLSLDFPPSELGSSVSIPGLLVTHRVTEPKVMMLLHVKYTSGDNFAGPDPEKHHSIRL